MTDSRAAEFEELNP